MSYNLKEAEEILSRTPQVLRTLLLGLDENWLNFRKRPDGYNPSEVIGHLIQNEEDNFITRMNVIQSNYANKSFPPFDREGFDKNLSLEQRIDLFSSLRKKNLQTLEQNFKESDLDKKGIHPMLGYVKLSELLSTWVVHDLTHLFQILEILGLRYKESVGPFVKFLKILNL